MNYFSKTVLLILITMTTTAAVRPFQSETREEALFRLNQIYNELDLLIRNQRSDRADVLHQNRDFEGLKVYERIPMQENLIGLQHQLFESTQRNGLKLGRVRILEHSPQPEKVPEEIITDRSFHLSADQIARTVFLEMDVKGTRKNLESWMSSVQDNQMRLVKVLDKKLKSHAGIWKVHIKSYQFRDIVFPRLRPRNPKEVLSLCSEKDSALENLAEKAQALIPRAAPFYENRREFLLNQARLEFFIKKSGEKR